MGIDRDEDSLSNGVETNTGTFVGPDDTGTNPALADTDGDGFDDGVEGQPGLRPDEPGLDARVAERRSCRASAESR